VEAAAIHAVAAVESGGRTGFDDQNRPKIRFETHVFSDKSGGAFDDSHPELTAAYGTRLYYASVNKDQWEVINAAFALDQDAAVMAASWGMFQVMGFNYEGGGWTTLREFVEDMFRSEAQHLRAFLGFCRANGLVGYLQSHNWAAFARGYNGPSYADNAYDTQLADAYARYSGG
jgi:hypothetical protein